VLVSAVQKAWSEKVFSVGTGGLYVETSCHRFITFFFHIESHFFLHSCVYQVPSGVVRYFLSFVRDSSSPPEGRVRPEGSITPYGGRAKHQNQVSRVQAQVLGRGLSGWKVRVWVRTACAGVGVVDAVQLGRVGVVGGPVHWLLWGGSCVCRVAVGLRLGPTCEVVSFSR
jgi:hypothetical protein